MSKVANVETVQKLAAEGKATKYIRAVLTIEGLDDKEISALIKEAGIGRNTAGFTQVNTMAFIEGGVTEYDLYQKLIDEGARNELRWISDRNRIRVTMNRVHEKYGNSIKEKPATAEQKEAAKKIVNPE